MSALFQAFRELIARYHWRRSQRFFDGMVAEARRHHAPTKYIEQARQAWVHRALMGRKA